MPLHSTMIANSSRCRTDGIALTRMVAVFPRLGIIVAIRPPSYTLIGGCHTGAWINRGDRVRIPAKESPATRADQPIARSG